MRLERFVNDERDLFDKIRDLGGFKKSILGEDISKILLAVLEIGLDFSRFWDFHKFEYSKIVKRVLNLNVFEKFDWIDEWR